MDFQRQGICWGNTMALNLKNALWQISASKRRSGKHNNEEPGAQKVTFQASRIHPVQQVWARRSKVSIRQANPDSCFLETSSSSNVLRNLDRSRWKKNPKRKYKTKEKASKDWLDFLAELKKCHPFSLVTKKKNPRHAGQWTGYTVEWMQLCLPVSNPSVCSSITQQYLISWVPQWIRKKMDKDCLHSQPFEINLGYNYSCKFHQFNLWILFLLGKFL